jgi:hypothetical protein
VVIRWSDNGDPLKGRELKKADDELKKEAPPGSMCGSCANLTDEREGRDIAGNTWWKCSVYAESAYSPWRRTTDGPCKEHWERREFDKDDPHLFDGLEKQVIGVASGGGGVKADVEGFGNGINPNRCGGCGHKGFVKRKGVCQCSVCDRQHVKNDDGVWTMKPTNNYVLCGCGHHSEFLPSSVELTTCSSCSRQYARNDQGEWHEMTQAAY